MGEKVFLMSREIKDGTQDMFEISKGDLTAFKNADLVGGVRKRHLRRTLLWAAVASSVAGIIGVAVATWFFASEDEMARNKMLFYGVAVPILNCILISLVFELSIWLSRRKGLKKDKTYEI
jgi:hypothetical protein